MNDYHITFVLGLLGGTGLGYVLAEIRYFHQAMRDNRTMKAMILAAEECDVKAARAVATAYLEMTR